MSILTKDFLEVLSERHQRLGQLAAVDDRLGEGVGSAGAQITELVGDVLDHWRLRAQPVGESRLLGFGHHPRGLFVLQLRQRRSCLGRIAAVADLPEPLLVLEFERFDRIPGPPRRFGARCRRTSSSRASASESWR
jgi:hypothetical protein